MKNLHEEIVVHFVGGQHRSGHGPASMDEIKEAIERAVGRYVTWSDVYDTVNDLEDAGLIAPMRCMFFPEGFVPVEEPPAWTASLSGGVQLSLFAEAALDRQQLKAAEAALTPECADILAELRNNVESNEETRYGLRFGEAYLLEAASYAASPRSTFAECRLALTRAGLYFPTGENGFWGMVLLDWVEQPAEAA